MSLNPNIEKIKEHQDRIEQLEGEIRELEKAIEELKQIQIVGIQRPARYIWCDPNTGEICWGDVPPEKQNG